MMKLSETNTSKSCFKSESWNSFLYYHDVYFRMFREWIFSSILYESVDRENSVLIVFSIRCFLLRASLFRRQENAYGTPADLRNIFVNFPLSRFYRSLLSSFSGS
jgi:hypothetical protein